MCDKILLSYDCALFHDSRSFSLSSARSDFQKTSLTEESLFSSKMDLWGKWNFSPESEDRLNLYCSKLENRKPSKLSDEWLALLNSFPASNDDQMEVDVSPVNPEEKEIFNAIQEAIDNDTIIPETTFVGISVNSLNRILASVAAHLDEFRFCIFCKFIASWNSFTLVEHTMKSIVLPKLKETKEASGCVIYSLKELTISKPDQFGQNVLIPLLSDNNFQFTDVDLLSAVFPVLSTSQKDLVNLSFTKKDEFLENDWLLLHPLIKDLSQNNLLQLLECIEKFSYKFTKSQIFGRFLVSFCKNLNSIGNKDVLREVIEKHQTLLKTQALKYLECI